MPEQDLTSILAHHQDTHGQRHWFSTSPLSWSLCSFMLFLTISLNRITALLPSVKQSIVGFEFEVKFTKQRKAKITRQQLMLPMQSIFTHKGIMMATLMKLLMLSNFLQMRKIFCHTKQWQHLQRGRICHICTPNQRLLHQTPVGQLCKISQQMHENIYKSLVSSTLLRSATEVESLIDSAFSFEVSYDSYF